MKKLELTDTSMVGLPPVSGESLLPSFWAIKNMIALLASSTLWKYSKANKLKKYPTACLVPIIFNGFSSFVTSAES